MSADAPWTGPTLKDARLEPILIVWAACPLGFITCDTQTICDTQSRCIVKSFETAEKLTPNQAADRLLKFEEQCQHDRHELAERFAHQRRTTSAAIDEIADML